MHPFLFLRPRAGSTNCCLLHLTNEAFYQKLQHFFRISIFVPDMRPAYSHKSFGDERLSYIFLMLALATDSSL